MSVIAIQVLPSADIHLVNDLEVFDRMVQLKVLGFDIDEDRLIDVTQHEETLFKIVPTEGAQTFDVNEIGLLTPIVSNDNAGFLSVFHRCILPSQEQREFEVMVRVYVHDSITDIFLGNSSGTVNVGSDNFQITVFAIFSGIPPISGDITGHGYVEFESSDPGKATVDPITGRVTGVSIGRCLIRVKSKFDESHKGDVPINIHPPIGAVRESVVRVKEGGPPSEVRNILFLSEGFKQEEKPIFKAMVREITKNLRTMSENEPFGMLNDSYNVWRAFEASAENGISPGDHASNSQDFIFMKARDSYFGMMYDQRQGDIVEIGLQSRWSEDEISRWETSPRSLKRLCKDLRRTGSNYYRWKKDFLQYLSGLRWRSRAGSAEHPDYEIGKYWAEGGKDEGLVILLVNDHHLDGRYISHTINLDVSTSKPKVVDKALFAVASTVAHHTITEISDNLHDVRISPNNHNKVLITSIVAHELGHAFFLGDEYEDTGSKGRNRIEETLHRVNIAYCDNLVSFQEQIECKWNWIFREEKSSGILSAMNETRDGKPVIAVRLMKGEGRKWEGSERVSLRTRNKNIQMPRALMDLYPIYRRHHPYDLMHQTPPGLRSIIDLDKSTDVIYLEGSLPVLIFEVEQNGQTVQVPYIVRFPKGSLVYVPKEHANNHPTLILPQVSNIIWGTSNQVRPLHTKGNNDCQHPNEDPVVQPQLYGQESNINIATDQRQHLIGLYEGGGGWNCGVYRPSGVCKLRNSVLRQDSNQQNQDSDEQRSISITLNPFCHVCKHTIVSEINPSLLAKLDDDFYPGTL